MFILAKEKLHNIWVFQIYSLFEFVLVLTLLKCWLNDEKSLSAIRYAIPLYYFFFLIVKLTELEPPEPSTFNFITRPIALLVMVFFIFRTLFELWENTTIDLEDDYRFWILFAFMVYYASSMVLFSFSFVPEKKFLLPLVYTHAVLNIIHNLLFTVGAFKARSV